MGRCGVRNNASGDFDAAALANRATVQLRAYDPGPDLPSLRERFGVVLAELGSNESPFGPSLLVLEAMDDALAEIHRYPDPRGVALRRALANHLDSDVERIALGNGSHELLMLIAQCFADAAHSIVYSQYGFAVFPIAAAASGARGIAVAALPRDHPSAPLGHDLDAIGAAIEADTRIVYLANPNNPTGTWFDDEALRGFLARVSPQVLVVVDEAYHEYVSVPGVTSALRFVDEHPNLIVTRTFSKAYALAGLRVGYVVAHPSAVAVLERLRESFNVNHLAQVAAKAALADVEHVARMREWNAVERGWLRAALEQAGFACLPSQTNFLLVDFAQGAEMREQALFEQGIIVRPMAGYGLPQMLRISVGNRAENQRLIAAVSA